MTPTGLMGLVLEWGTLGGVLANAVVLFFVERRLLAVERELERFNGE